MPTVPMDPQYLAAWTLPADSALLEPDLRFKGQIKWYTKPLVFDGDAGDPSNTHWVSGEKHVQLVARGGTVCFEKSRQARATPNNRSIVEVCDGSES